MGKVTDQEGIQCPLCVDQLVQPTTLLCQHVYCRRCLTAYVRASIKHGRFTCPRCRRSLTPEEAGLGDVIGLPVVVEAEEEVDQGHRCEEVGHENLQAHLFCDDHDRKICGKCVLERHKGCDMCDIAEVPRRMRQKLDALQKRTDGYLSSVVGYENHMKKAFQKARDKLDEQEEDIMPEYEAQRREVELIRQDIEELLAPRSDRSEPGQFELMGAQISARLDEVTARTLPALECTIDCNQVTLPASSPLNGPELPMVQVRRQSLGQVHIGECSPDGSSITLNNVSFGLWGGGLTNWKLEQHDEEQGTVTVTFALSGAFCVSEGRRVKLCAGKGRNLYNDEPGSTAIYCTGLDSFSTGRHVITRLKDRHGQVRAMSPLPVPC